MNRHWLAILVFWFCGPIQAADSEMRHFGYFIGDLVTQRIALHRDGQNFELGGPLSLLRVNVWLQRRGSILQRDQVGRDWLLVTYQIVNSPRETLRIELPGLNLPLVNGESLRIAPISISLSPLTPAAETAAGNLPPIRPDRQPAPPATTAAQRLRLMVLGLGASLIAWLGWWAWRRYKDAKPLPFADAWGRLRDLQPQRIDENPDAWLALHRAFNATAGRSIHGANVSALFHRAPWLQSQQAHIESFYLSSSARFFAQTPQPPPFTLIEFGRALYRAEKRHVNSHGAPR